MAAFILCRFQCQPKILAKDSMSVRQLAVGLLPGNWDKRRDARG
jgi:hypothetical protein